MRLVTWVEALSRWSGRLSAWLVLVAMLMMVYEVVRRYVFNSPTLWVHETSTLLLGAMYALTGAFALLERSHVGVDVFYARWPRKIRAVSDLLMSVFLFLFAGTLVVYGWRFFMDSYNLREFSLNWDQMPLFPFKLMIPLGGLLVFLQGVANAIRSLGVLLGSYPEGEGHGH